MVKVKICGIRSLLDARLSVELGADFIGLNFWPGSKRVISSEEAGKIVKELKGKVKLVGVFVNQDLNEVKEIVERYQLDYIQLHGEEDFRYCQKFSKPVIKALGLSSEKALKIMDKYQEVIWLIDSKTQGYGGSGVKPDWELAKKAKQKAGRIILAGGLNPENVKEAVQKVGPWVVDVASGVESAVGVKDPERLKKFFKAVRDVSE